MMRIDDSWLHESTTQEVCAALTISGARALFVGGCVRNALLGVPVSDLDIATNALPETVVTLAEAAGIKAVPTGLEHGTVTLVHNGVPFEITTFRKDIETDGRRAVVSFSTDIADDAARRDFTMNALYARPDGTIEDPLGGLADLKQRRVRFIGTARNRIREDYLRSLRFFRFHAWYGDRDHGFDPDAMDAIASNLEGLARLSRERVGVELMKLLSAPDPAPSVAGMRVTGVLGQLLPGADDRALAPLIHLEGERPANPILRLAAICDGTQIATLRLSKSQVKEHTRLRAAASGLESARVLGYRLGANSAYDAVLLRAALLDQPISPDLVTETTTGAEAEFPLKAADLMPDLSGAELGQTLKKLEAEWLESGFTLTRQELLARRQ